MANWTSHDPGRSEIPHLIRHPGIGNILTTYILHLVNQHTKLFHAEVGNKITQVE